MKKIAFIVLALTLVCGCSKKQEVLDSEQAMSGEEINVVTDVEQQAIPLAGEEAITAKSAVEAIPLETEPFEYIKPSGEEIQTALKNAGYYSGPIDGDIGPKTKKAIEDFQQANGLAVDGKVGRKTWAVLSKSLNTAPGTSAQSE
ncbi:MAG: peptidoglycan-binding domain-containing protein [Candidatus Omnitrophota bacterium]